MGKNKLQKFREMEDFPHVFQHPFSALKESEFEMRGRWKEMVFGNDHPLIVELGCGKGEYTVGLAKLYPEINFIGIDIKGARIWSGAKQSYEEQMPNVAFLRTHIELIDRFFAPDEISGIWITFPDPQMGKINKRMTSSRFMKLYSKVLTDNGSIHLKSDSNFLYTYTTEMIRANRFPVEKTTADLYKTEAGDPILSIRTFYEAQWLERGLNIKYIHFRLPRREEYTEPETEIEPDDYRSYNRGKRSGKQMAK